MNARYHKGPAYRVTDGRPGLLLWCGAMGLREGAVSIADAEHPLGNPLG